MLWVGTSGWQYTDWRGPFYPERLPQRLWLDHYAARFACVEVNSTFYRLPAEAVFAGWAERAPAGFRFALKLSRYISHVRRLTGVADALLLFLQRSQPLGDHAGPLLLQLPPTLPADPGRLREVLAAVPGRHRIAVEVRHAAWLSSPVLAVLRERNAALCLADRDGEAQGPLVATSSWGYLRLHRGGPSSWGYSEAALRRWADRVRSLWGDGADVYAFFNNDPGCAAVRDAAAFARCCAEAGLPVSRVPGQAGG